MRFTFPLLPMAFAALGALAVPALPATVPAEPESIRRFDEATWEELSEGLDYEEPPLPEQDRSRQKERAARTPFAAGAWGMLMTIVLYAALALAVVAVVLVLVRHLRIPRKIREKPPDGLDDVEDLAELDLEGLLRRAEEESRWKDALRLHFLIILHRLTEKSWIAWQKDKTNRDYVEEMRRAGRADGFRELTRLFEQVWYGDAEVDAETFRRLRPGFSRFADNL